MSAQSLSVILCDIMSGEIGRLVGLELLTVLLDNLNILFYYRWLKMPPLNSVKKKKNKKLGLVTPFTVSQTNVNWLNIVWLHGAVTQGWASALEGPDTFFLWSSSSAHCCLRGKQAGPGGDGRHCRH